MWTLSQRSGLGKAIWKTVGHEIQEHVVLEPGSGRLSTLARPCRVNDPRAARRMSADEDYFVGTRRLNSSVQLSTTCISVTGLSVEGMGLFIRNR
jgi:hypothetical protein